MEFEFDAANSQANQTKHGIDFNEARALWEDPDRVVFLARLQDEERHGIIARNGYHLWCAIFTYRQYHIRIISVRRARDYEKEIYYQGGGF